MLAAGNFRVNSTVADLVVGVPDEYSGSGSVYIIGGSPSGLGDAGVQILSQNTAGVGGSAEAGDQFGRALATGDFDADLRDDLAVGVPFEDLTNNSQADAGAVQVFFGNIFGGNDFVDAHDVFITQTDLPSLGSSVEAGDRFGWALAVGRFDSDGFDDLAIGVPGEDIGSIVDAGVVDVLYGSLTGPSFTRVQTWHQDVTGITDFAEAGDQFGYALSAWNYGKDSRSDLAIGVPFEGINGQEDAGAVHVIYGSPGGLTSTGDQFWHQDVPGTQDGVKDTAQPGDRFGQALY